MSVLGGGACSIFCIINTQIKLNSLPGEDVIVPFSLCVSFPLRCLSKGMNAIVEIQTQRPVSLELYKDYKELGRFMLRYVGSTIAAGVVTEVMSN